MGYNKNAFSADIFKRASFTIIELLIALSIFSVIAASVYSAFHAGLFAWQRLNVTALTRQQAAVTLDLMADEIASFVPSEKVKFEGSAGSVSFLARLKDADKYYLAKVSFFFDSSSNSLMRGETRGEEIIAEELFSGVKSLEFKYFCKAPGPQDDYVWLSSLDYTKGFSCCAVSVSISTGDNFRKIIPLPAEVVSGQSV